MHHLILLTFSLIISMVPFSVAVSSSIYRCIEWKETFRMAFIFAGLQALLVAIGWVIGYGVKGLFYDMKVPVALIIMFFIGFRLFMESLRKGRELRTIVSEDRRILLGYAFVTGINPALLGISLGILYTGILPLIGFVFGVIFVLVILGIRAGKMGWMTLGRAAEMIGALALFAISMLSLIQYLK